MPYKTQYGSHYHETYGCHGATIPCDTAGLTPCSDCCGAGSEADAGEQPVGAAGGSIAGMGAAHDASSGDFSVDGGVATAPDDSAVAGEGEDTGDDLTPTSEDMGDAETAIDSMTELYATGSMTAPDPSLLGRLSRAKDKAKAALSTGLALARNRLTDACSRLGSAASALRNLPASLRRQGNGGGNRKVLRKLGAVAATFAFALSMSGCGTTALAGRNTSEAEQYTAAQAIHQMEESDTLTLRKANFSWGDRWDVFADGEFVATIDGEALYLVGDTYTLRSTNGDIIMSEQEELGFVTRRASKHDADGNEVGRYDENFDLLHHRIGFTDADGKATGSIESRVWPITSRNHAEIMDADGEEVWDYSEEWFTVDGAAIHLERENASDDVDVTDAVMGAAIYHEQTAPKKGGSSGGNGSGGGNGS